jgi:pimeloyl-ACP methyl ester carboxylesterase
LQFRRSIDAVRDDVRIPSRGEELAAYVYRPDATGGDAPCVVMAHGFSATRDDGLPGLKMPLLMCVCDNDATTPVAPAVKAAERAPRAELRHYPYGHFRHLSRPTGQGRPGGVSSPHSAGSARLVSR